MSKILIVYWSATGNTEKMAELIEQGAKAAGADVTLKAVADASPADLDGFDTVVLGCPSMGAEELDPEMEEFVAAISGSLSGKKLALFGSYDWGDGEWMRNWYVQMEQTGAQLVQSEGLIVQLMPEGEAEEQCTALGASLA